MYTLISQPDRRAEKGVKSAVQDTLKAVYYATVPVTFYKIPETHGQV